MPTAEALPERWLAELACQRGDERLRPDPELLLARPLPEERPVQAERLALLPEEPPEGALRREAPGQRLRGELLPVLLNERRPVLLDREGPERARVRELRGHQARLAVVRGVEHHVSPSSSMVSAGVVFRPDRAEAIRRRGVPSAPFGAAAAMHTQRACQRVAATARRAASDRRQTPRGTPSAPEG